MSPERRAFFSSDRGADFVEFPVEAFRGDHQRLPARLDEGRGCIGRHLAQVVGVHLTQGLHGCQHALRGRPVLFPNFSLGEEYEHAPPATNRQISPYLPSGRFRTGLPVEGLAIERGDLFLCMSARASVFLWHGARRRPSDARRKHACHGRDKHHRRCSFKRRTGLVMRTTTCVWSGLLLRPDQGCPRSSVAFRVRRTCTGRVIFGPRMIAAIAAGGLVRGRGQSSQGAVIAAPATLKTHRRSGGLVIACHYARPIYCSQR